MTIQVKKAIFNLITTALFMGGYIFYTFVIQADKNIPRVDDLEFWGKFMLVMMGVIIALKIISYIVFYAVVTGIYKDEDPEFMDDYDKQIEMRSDRNSHHVFILGFVCCFIPIALGHSVSKMFVILLVAGFVSSLISDLSKIYYYNKGI